MSRTYTARSSCFAKNKRFTVNIHSRDNRRCATDLINCSTFLKVRQKVHNFLFTDQLECLRIRYSILIGQ